ncbi:MAG: hypothetical protein KGM47_14075 [Acidobacteriota bacterium]|nr:hypothetical protein [Acidobacteriota bacterium]
MLTFHNIIAGCETGSAEAWRAFLRGYTPIVRELARVYLPGPSDADDLWRNALSAMVADDYRVLRGFDHQSDREFLTGLRAFYFDNFAPGPAQENASFPEPTPSSIASLMKGVPLIHQEVLFLKLAGYSNATLEKMFRITPAVAESSLAQLKEGYSAALENQTDKGLRPAAWLRMLHELRTATTDACPPLRLLIRIQDGQIGWAEKDPAETHMAGCLSCLERWTALIELAYWRRTVKPASPAEVESLLSSLPTHEDRPKRQPLFKKLFG